MQYGEGASLYPTDPKLRSSVDRWLDWSLASLQPAERPVFWGYIRTPAAKRELVNLKAAEGRLADMWKVIDGQLQRREFIETDAFTLADLVLAIYARRWYGIPEEIYRPSLPNVERWYRQMGERAGFRRYISMPLT